MFIMQTVFSEDVQSSAIWHDTLKIFLLIHYVFLIKLSWSPQ